MSAAVLVGLEQVELRGPPEPVPRPVQVVVQVEAPALCGTDVHQDDGRSTPPSPASPGTSSPLLGRRVPPDAL